MKSPVVTIIVPVFNREKLVRKALDSVIRQTMQEWEVIAVDNCSTDQTWEVLVEYSRFDSRIKIFQNKENIGPVRNWIEGLSKVRTEFSKFLWSDDWLAENYLQETLDIFKAYPECGFVYSPVDIISAQGVTEAYRLENAKIRIPGEIFYRGLVESRDFPVSPGCGMFRTADLKQDLKLQIKNLDKLDFSRYGAGNDLLMFLLPLLRYNYFGYAAKTRAYFLAHSDSFTISNNLSLYYSYAMVEFLNQKKEFDLKKKFAYSLLRQDPLRRRFGNVLIQVGKFPMDWRFVVNFLIRGIPELIKPKRS